MWGVHVLCIMKMHSTSRFFPLFVYLEFLRSHSSNGKKAAAPRSVASNCLHCAPPCTGRTDALFVMGDL